MQDPALLSEACKGFIPSKVNFHPCIFSCSWYEIMVFLSWKSGWKHVKSLTLKGTYSQAANKRTRAKTRNMLFRSSIKHLSQDKENSLTSLEYIKRLSRNSLAHSNCCLQDKGRALPLCPPKPLSCSPRPPFCMTNAPCTDPSLFSHQLLLVSSTRPYIKGSSWCSILDLYRPVKIFAPKYEKAASIMSKKKLCNLFFLAL